MSTDGQEVVELSGQQEPGRGRVWDLPVRVLVHTAEAATAVYSALDWISVQIPPEPAALGRRWWSLRGSCVLPPPDSLVHAIKGACEDALAVWTEDGQRFDALLIAQGDAVELIDAKPVDVVAWAAARRPSLKAPRPVFQLTRTRPEPDPLDDPVATWLVDAGWPLHQGFTDNRLLADFRWEYTLGSPSIAGETRLSWRAARWAGGHTRSGRWGLWDRDGDRQPVLEWPGEDRAGADLRAELMARLIDPVLRASTLPEHRWWTTASRDVGPAGPAAVLVHYRSDGHMSVILPTDPPHTYELSRPGFITLAGDSPRAFGVPVQSLTGIDVPLADEDTALRAARASLPMDRLAEWTPVPAGVPIGLLETAAWIRDQLPG